MTCPDRLIALIPAYNEEATVGQIVDRVQQLWGCRVVVIDDCSADATASVASAAGATVLPLTIQLGAWGAIQTGLRYALQQGYRTAVTLDGILGMNLLLPSGTGMTMLGAATQLPAPFERVVIDVAHERLGFALRR